MDPPLHGEVVRGQIVPIDSKFSIFPNGHIDYLVDRQLIYLYIDLDQWKYAMKKLIQSG